MSLSAFCLIFVSTVLCFVKPITAGGFCYGKHNGDYRDPNNCYGFITCSNGLTYYRDCPDDLMFNEAKDECDNNVSCAPVDGGWSAWSPWYPCTVTCGGGTQIRVRSCTNPPPSNGGKPCVGSNIDVRACATQCCPFSCRGKHNGDYADPDNSYGFISCSNGIAYHMPCPAGLKFNAVYDKCDWPHNVKS